MSLGCLHGKERGKRMSDKQSSYLSDKNAEHPQLTVSFTIATADLLGISGFACCLSWFLLMLMNPLLDNVVSRESAFATVLAFAVGELLGCGISWVFSKRLVQPRIIRVTLALVAIFASAPAISALAFAVDSNISSLLVIWLLAGVGFILLLGFWGFFLGRLKHREAVLYPPVSCALVILIILLTLFALTSYALNIAMTLLPCMSVFLFILWARKTNIASILACQTETRPPDWKSLLRSAAAMVANGYILGFVYLAVSINLSSGVSLSILLAMLAAALYKVYDSRHNQRYEVYTIIRIIAPTITFGLLMIAVLEVKYWVLCLVIMACIAGINEIVCWSAVSEYMYVCRLLPFSNIGFGRLGNVLGVALGYATGFVILGKGYTDAVTWPSDMLISVVVIAMVIIQSFLFRDNYQPFTEHKSLSIDMDQPSSGDGLGAWQRKLSSFAKENRLTPVQTKVLFMLAKGYSTSYMKDELVVSKYTIKAHVYAIYRKTDVHSRQELITKIECYMPQ
jgi:DNA-binding CsgD family transcriptional regulator